MSFVREKGKGIGICLMIAIPSWFLGKQFPLIGGPVFGILIGMLLAGLAAGKTGWQPGITFVSKKVLQYAVILLGFGMNLWDIISRGKQSLPIIIGTISISLFIAWLICRMINIPSKIGILIGVGSSICGGSAIAATAPVIHADDEEVAQAISVIFLFNIIAALLFPAMGELLKLSNEGFGFFAGLAINDTSSVTAAAAVWDGRHGSNTLEIATVVKLTRTLAIIPITLVLSLYEAKKNHETGKNHKKSRLEVFRSFPTFILFFILAAVVTTFCNLPGEVTGFLKNMSKFFIIMAMSAIGINTNIVKLIKAGGKPFLLGGVCWGCIMVTSLLFNYGLGFW